MQFPLPAAVQFMAARIGLVTGHDLTRILREHYPRWVLGAACVLLFVANILTARAPISRMWAPGA